MVRERPHKIKIGVLWHLVHDKYNINVYNRSAGVGEGSAKA